MESMITLLFLFSLGHAEEADIKKQCPILRGQIEKICPNNKCQWNNQTEYLTVLNSMSQLQPIILKDVEIAKDAFKSLEISGEFLGQLLSKSEIFGAKPCDIGEFTIWKQLLKSNYTKTETISEPFLNKVKSAHGSASSLVVDLVLLQSAIEQGLINIRNKPLSMEDFKKIKIAIQDEDRDLVLKEPKEIIKPGFFEKIKNWWAKFYNKNLSSDDSSDVIEMSSAEAGRMYAKYKGSFEIAQKHQKAVSDWIDKNTVK